MLNENKIITRFAPSPTGLLHAGNYRTAVFSYLFARQNGGKFLLRIEDTDKERSKKEYAENILESLNWLGLDYDNSENIPRQSERTTIYQKYIEQLLKSDKAYIAKEEIKKEGDRAEVIRFRNPNKKITFKDLIRGEVTTDTSDLGDFIIAKSLNEPIFHLAVVIDDYEMNISHVIRGEDHIPNTPRQILIQEAIGAPTPQYAHLPLLLSPDRTKLSKRKGALAITEYRDQGYLPSAILNFMAMLGWNPGTDQEIFFKDELISTFNISKVQKGGAIFNIEKLQWFNREHLRLLSNEEFIKQADPYLEKLKSLSGYSSEKIISIIPLILERIYTLDDLKKMVQEGELDYFFTQPSYNKELLKTVEFLPSVINKLQAIDSKDFSAQNIKDALWDFATEKGRANVLGPMRIALTGLEKSPDPFTVASILGKNETITRLQQTTT